MASHQETPLEKIEGWPPELIRKLKETWITTAEQLVATAATTGGHATLAQHLGITEEEVRRLVAGARQHIPPDVAARLEQPIDTSEYPLGARLDEPETDVSSENT